MGQPQGRQPALQAWAWAMAGAPREQQAEPGRQRQGLQERGRVPPRVSVPQEGPLAPGSQRARWRLGLVPLNEPAPPRGRPEPADEEMRRVEAAGPEPLEECWG